MITGTNHTGFVVKDLESSLRFYCDVVGFKVVRSVERDGPPISQLLGYENARIKGAHLGIQGDEHLLELIEYLSPPVSDRPTEERNAEGASHLALDVEDIEVTYNDLIARGARNLNPPVELMPGRTVCYLQDPDGNWLELIEDKS